MMLTASVSGETCTNLMFALRLEVSPSPPLHAASDKASAAATITATNLLM